jgi:hypothetical protein
MLVKREIETYKGTTIVEEDLADAIERSILDGTSRGIENRVELLTKVSGKIIERLVDSGLLKFEELNDFLPYECHLPSNLERV